MGADLIFSLVEKDERVTTETLSDRFGIQEMMESEGKDNRFLVSFLYYFGVLTLDGETDESSNSA